MSHNNNSPIPMDSMETECPVTGLPVCQLPEFTDVPVKEGYFTTLKKIGEAILSIESRGDLSCYDPDSFAQVIKIFREKGGITKPALIILSLEEAKGHLTFQALKKDMNYFISEYTDLKAFILVGEPSWMKPFLRQALRIFKPGFAFFSSDHYSDALKQAGEILGDEISGQSDLGQANEDQIGGDHSDRVQTDGDRSAKGAEKQAAVNKSEKPLRPEDILFKEEWVYKSAMEDFECRLGAIPEQLFYTSLHGSLNRSEDVANYFSLSQKVIDENRLSGMSCIVMDYSELAPVKSLRLRQLFAREVSKKMANIHNDDIIQLVIKPDRFNRIAIRLFTTFTRQRIIIVDSKDEAFDLINRSNDDAMFGPASRKSDAGVPDPANRSNDDTMLGPAPRKSDAGVSDPARHTFDDTMFGSAPRKSEARVSGPARHTFDDQVAGFTEKSIRVSPADLEEISDAFGVLQWADTNIIPTVKVSPDNPLAYLAESLELVKSDINELRENERKTQEERLLESETSRRKLIGMMRDTEAARVALEKEEEYRRILLDNIRTQVWYLTDETTYGAVNKAHADFMGFRIDDMAFKCFHEVYPEEVVREWKEINDGVFAEKKPIRIEKKIKHHSGEVRILAISITPKLRTDSSVEFVVCSAEDITERKKAEAVIEKSLEEKSILLSEIHHRVKNNMAVISSMLSLKSEFAGDREDFEGLMKDLQTRIMSMAWVHELVYESKNFSQINTGLLLSRLSSYLKNIYQPDDKDVSVEVRTGDVMLNMNNSVPLTLLVAEILTNTWKHAFTGRSNGRISIVLEKKDSGLHLIIDDDGIGVDDLDKLNQPESFGYTIIHGLAGQLRGKLAFSSGRKGGLLVEVLFPENL